MKKILRSLSALSLSILFISPASAEIPSVKGQVVRDSITATGTVNMTQLSITQGATMAAKGKQFELSPLRRPPLSPPVQDTGVAPQIAAALALAEATPVPQQKVRGWVGLTHLDQRNARGGNQFSTEPPDQGLAVGNGFVLEAVNSALNVYDTNGVQLLPNPV